MRHRVIVTAVACVLGVGLLNAQAQQAGQKPTADKVFKNVRVLTGIPVDEFMATMGFFSASLGMTCTDCHTAESGGSWPKYADDTPLKQTTRRMIGMVAGINKIYFGGKREVTCYSCHRGGDRPVLTPSLVELYGPPGPTREPDQLVQPEGKGATADQILNKFIEAVGGAQHWAAITSFVGKGTYQGYAESEKHPFEIFAKAPDMRTTILHGGPGGDTITTFDSHTAWTSAPATDKPVSPMELTGGDLIGAKLDAELAFPANIKQDLTQWRVGFPAEIDDREVQLVQGTADGRYPINLYFDGKTGLLVRSVRYQDSPVGLNPTQVDYSDYRDVNGVKMPFHWTTTWLDGRAIVELSEINANVPMDASKFAKPPAPKAQ